MTLNKALAALKKRNSNKGTYTFSGDEEWLEISDVDFSKVEHLFDDLMLRKLIFRNCTFKDCTFMRTSLLSCEFTNCNLSGVRLAGAIIRYVCLYNCNLSCASAHDCSLLGVRLYGERTNTYNAQLGYCNVAGSSINGSKLDDSVRFISTSFTQSQGLKTADCSWEGFGTSSRRLTLRRVAGKNMFGCGCFYGDEKELRRWIRESGDTAACNRSRRKALDFLISTMPKEVIRKPRKKS